MKKIVGILAAAALIATSVFAADVSAQVRIAGNLFNYDGTTIGKDGKAEGSFKLLNAYTQARPYWSPYITLSSSSDEAGAIIKFVEDNDGTRAISMDRSNVWFKPIDMLKLEFGYFDYAMNKETIDWTSTNNDEGWGYAVTFAQDAISATVAFKTDNNGWFFEDAVAAHGSSETPNAAAIKDLYAVFSYGADFGTISAMFEYKGKNWSASGCNMDTMKFGAGYKNTIDAITFFADVVATSKTKWTDDEVKAIGPLATAAATAAAAAETDAYLAAKAAEDAAGKFEAATDKDGNQRGIFGLAVDGFVQYAQDALTAKGYLKLNIADFDNLNNKGDKDMMYANNTALTLKARADYKLDNGITVYGYFGCDNLLRKETKNGDTDPYSSSVFASTIKAGATGSVGIVTWETWLEFATGANVAYKAGVDKDTWGKYDKVTVAMPIWITAAF